MKSIFNDKFLVCCVLFISLLIASNLMATKTILLLGIILPAAVFVYPFTFMLGDVITEVFGYKKMKQVIVMGFLASVIVALCCWIGIYLPYPDFYAGQASYEAIFGIIPRILIASLLAYLVGEYINAYIMQRMKKRHGHKRFYQRTISSSVVGQVFDSAIFITIAFAGTMPLSALLLLIAGQYGVKIAIEAFLGTPLAYLLRSKMQKNEESNEK